MFYFSKNKINQTMVIMADSIEIFLKKQTENQFKFESHLQIEKK